MPGRAESGFEQHYSPGVLLPLLMWPSEGTSTSLLYPNVARLTTQYVYFFLSKHHCETFKATATSP